MVRLFIAGWTMNRLLARNLIFFAIVIALTTTSSGSKSDAGVEHFARSDYADHIEHSINDSTGNNTHNVDAHHAHGVHVVHIQFSYIEQPLILSLFLIAVVLIKMGQPCSVLLLLLFFID